MTRHVKSRESILGKARAEGYRDGVSQMTALAWNEGYLLLLGLIAAEARASSRWPTFIFGLVIGGACGVIIAGWLA